MEKWQNERNITNKRQLTKKLLATITPWEQREFGETVTRMKMKNDDGEHTLFKCDRFREERE